MVKIKEKYRGYAMDSHFVLCVYYNLLKLQNLVDVFVINQIH